jgi:predicted phage gp36 major capsid-like protein
VIHRSGRRLPFVVPVFDTEGMHDRVIDALQVLHGTTDDPLARVAAAEVVKAWADAEQARALADASHAQPAFLDPTGRMLDPAAAEIAAALTWTTRTADDRIDLALHLRHHLPGVWQALADG